ncbi:MAG: type I methionyl aminopeptidase [bacterium]|nr:type I methionyl aminopeptidase [bacterium]
MARLKSAEQIAGIWRSGQIAGLLQFEIAEQLKPGMTTGEVDAIGAEFIAKHGAIPAFLGYNGYPGNICVSVNQEVVHGIPGSRVINAGDVVSVDVGVVLDGYFSDHAKTYFVGDQANMPEKITRLLSGTRRSLHTGIDALRAGEPLRLASRAIEQELRRHKLAVIRELTGHGTGTALHEEPTVYNFDPGGRRPLVENGMVLAIEPMAALGSENVLLAADNWTYYTADGSLAAHFEHTVALWDGQVMTLTDPADESAKLAFGNG